MKSENMKLPNHWQAVLFRILSIIKMGESCFIFQNKTDKLYKHINGNFFNLIQLLWNSILLCKNMCAEFDKERKECNLFEQKHSEFGSNQHNIQRD